MKKTNSLELLKWLFWTLIAAYGLGYLVAIVLSFVSKVPEHWYNSIPTVFILLVFVIFFYRQLSRLDVHLPLKEKKVLRQTNSRVIPVNTSNGTKNLFLSSVKSIFASETTQASSQLLYWEYGNYIIREDIAYEWLRKGWRRQTWGEAHPYSGNWMTKQRFYTLSNQRIDLDYHKCLVILISEHGLWLKHPAQGTSGKVLLSPTLCLERFKGNLAFDN